MVPLVTLAVLMLHAPPALTPRVERTVPAATAPTPALDEPEAPSVRVEHEWVRLPRPRPPQLSRPRPWRSTRMAVAPPPDSRATMVAKARRALIGDGRYRPEPFPRLER